MSITLTQESETNKMDDGVLARVDAIEILRRWMDTGDFPDRMMVGVPPFRRGFVMDLVYTTLRNVRALDYVLEPLVQREPADHAMPALLVGACQLLKMPDVADHAAIHATVEALKHLDGTHASGFVNAVLRNIQRKLDSIRMELARAPLAVRESHPDEQVERWERRFGPERAAAICAWDNEPASVTVVTVPRGPAVAALLESFVSAGVKAEPHAGAPDRAVVLPHGSHVEDLPGFKEGAFSIQDPATLEAVLLLDVRPGMRVLDACAAPGGKSVQIGLRLDGRGTLVSMDCWRDRMPSLEENLRRFKLGGVARAELGDARRIPLSEIGGQAFDRILLDVPCSNTGVQRRRADARWRFSAERLTQLVDTQSQILENCAAMLAPGGRLVYSTCSLEPEENEQVVEGFLRRHAGFALAEHVGLVPPDRSMDGAFAAAIRRD